MDAAMIASAEMVLNEDPANIVEPTHQVTKSAFIDKTNIGTFDYNSSLAPADFKPTFNVD